MREPSLLENRQRREVKKKGGSTLRYPTSIVIKYNVIQQERKKHTHFYVFNKASIEKGH